MISRHLLHVQIVVMLAAPLGGQSAPAWRLVREVSFGGSGDAASELSDIRGFEVSKNGNVLVLDYKSQNIRVFAPSGQFIKAIGRKGQGPGEFLEPMDSRALPTGASGSTILPTAVTRFIVTTASISGTSRRR